MKTIREHVRECAYKEIEELKKKYSYDLSLFRIAEREALRDNDKTFDEVLRLIFVAKEYGLNFDHVQQKTENWTGRQRIIKVWFKTNGVLGLAKGQAHISIKALIEREVAEAVGSDIKQTKVSEWSDELGEPITLIKYTKNE